MCKYFRQCYIANWRLIALAQGHTEKERGAEIISKSVKLVKSAKIVKIEGTPEGLCVESPAEAPLCGAASKLTGKTLKPGSYTMYPNIPMNKDRQSATVFLK